MRPAPFKPVALNPVVDQLIEHGLPLTPISYQTLLLDEKMTELYFATCNTYDAYKKAWDSKMSDYRALINGSNTLEQVEKVWPEASALRPRVMRTLPVVLSNDVIERIRNDKRKQVEEKAA